MRTCLKEREVETLGERVRSLQKPSPSSNVAVEAQEHVSTTEAESRLAPQDMLFPRVPRSLQVTPLVPQLVPHLGTSGNESQSRRRNMDEQLTCRGGC